jgi:hypothetical protein
LWHDNARVQICQAQKPQCVDGEERTSSFDEEVINLDDINELEIKPIISIYLRQSSYRRAQPRFVGNHFMVEEPKTIFKFEPTLQTMVKDLICLSASFGRTMTEFAAAEGERYQYEGPHDVETEVGWTSGPESLVKVRYGAVAHKSFDMKEFWRRDARRLCVGRL